MRMHLLRHENTQRGIGVSAAAARTSSSNLAGTFGSDAIRLKNRVAAPSIAWDSITYAEE